MSLFKSLMHQDIWIQHHCDRCYFGQSSNMCKILARALKTGRKPVEWERNPRSTALMAETIKCHSETRTPPSLARPVVDEDVPMFDVISTERMDTDHQ